MDNNYLGDEKYWECFESIFFDSQSEAEDKQGLITSTPVHLSNSNFTKGDNNPASDTHDYPLVSDLLVEKTAEHPSADYVNKALKGGLR